MSVSVNFRCVVNNKHIDEYFHNNKIYVEGRKNSEYSLVLQNYSSKRYKAVISVDGLNILSGDKDWQKGYVLNPFETLKIPGWRIDNSSVAKFKFSSVKDSYNQHNLQGDVENVGVIGCMLFEEEYTSNIYFKDYGKVRFDLIPTSASNLSTNDEKMGTGWGQETKFDTVKVSYDFQTTPIKTFTIYYDSAKNLEKMGIVLKRNKIKKDPNPFPGYNRDGCPFPI